MLSEESIADALRRAAQHLERGNIEQSEATFRVLGFERLTRGPIEDSTKLRGFIDPAAAFGHDRVFETHQHIAAARSFMAAGKAESALLEIQAARERWAKKIPDRCPFCQQPAEFRSVGDRVEMDCQACRVQVTLAGTAAAMECQNPAATLRYIREQMQQGISRPLMTYNDMRR